MIKEISAANKVSEASKVNELNRAHAQFNLNDPAFLKPLRVQMLKFAQLQIRDTALAEDAVQEALIGALKNVDSFRHKSALKTWVFSILKFKIIDILRQQHRKQESRLPFENPDNNLHDTNHDHAFTERGFWQADEKPTAWSPAAETVKNEHFWRVFEVCLTDLSEKQARLFSMREFLELGAEEICETLNISASNLHVMLYRARLVLRECLEKRWFLKGDKP